MQVSDEIFDEKYYIYYYDGDITEAIDVIQHREDINDVIQQYPNLHYVIEYYGFCNTAYAYNGNRDDHPEQASGHPCRPCLVFRSGPPRDLTISTRLDVTVCTLFCVTRPNDEAIKPVPNCFK